MAVRNESITQAVRGLAGGVRTVIGRPLRAAVAVLLAGLAALALSVPAGASAGHVARASTASQQGPMQRVHGRHQAIQLFGLVDKVGTSTAATACGRPDLTVSATGSFRLTDPLVVGTGDKTGRDVSVEVGARTDVNDVFQSKATFDDVCVGSRVTVTGHWSGAMFTADKVFLDPLGAPAVRGTVVAVDGSTRRAACGRAGTTGTFILARDNDARTMVATPDWQFGGTARLYTVTVVPQTTYVGPSLMSPSFGDVCVGDPAAATGAFSGAAVAADEVYFPPRLTSPRTTPRPHIVASAPRPASAHTASSTVRPAPAPGPAAEPVATWHACVKGRTVARPLGRWGGASLGTWLGTDASPAPCGTAHSGRPGTDPCSGHHDGGNPGHEQGRRT